MGLRFIIGRAGSGKTTRCMEEIIEKGKAGGRQVLIVPEQFTSQTERDFIEACGQGAILSAEVLSFGRLAHRVFSKTGIGARVPLDEIGKSMALQKILLQEKKNIVYFQNVMDKPGFVEQLGLTLTEFFQYQITPEQTEALSQNEGLTAAAREKLADLSLIFRAYMDFLKKDYISGDEMLGLLAERLDKNAGFGQTEFWLDGFYGFTPQEFGVIRRLLLLSPQVTITLPMDRNTFYGAFLPPSAPFFGSWRAKQKLMELARELGADCPPPVILEENHRAETAALRELERNYFYAFFKKCAIAESVHITACPTIQDEIRFAAGKILRLAREDGCRFRDMAIVTNAMETYENSFRSILEEYRIPCFLDSRRNTAAHPLIILLSSLLDILVYDFKYEAVFSYLKSGLAPLTTEETDLLENYVLAYGIRGYKWKKKTWEYGLSREGAETLEQIQALKERVMQPFAPFLALSKTKKYPFREFLTLLREHLETLHAAEQLEVWAEEAAAAGNLNRTGEYRQIWQLVMDVLQKAEEILGEERLTLAEAAAILEAGLEQCTMGMIPPTVDCLLIGDIERSRLPEIKHLFVLGVNEGILPAPALPHGIFTENERDLLSLNGMELADGGRMKIFEEQFLIYLGLTKPSCGLWLTYAAGDSEGRAMSPSSLIDRLLRMDDTLVPFVQEPGMFLPCETAPEAAFHLLGAEMRAHTAETPMSSLWQDVYSFFDSSPKWSPRLKLLREGLGKNSRKERLSPKTARALYGKNILSSVSRLERFAGCPFSFFAEYGLGAKERQLYQLHTPDLGLLFHEVLERFSRRLETDGVLWTDLTKEQTETLIHQAVDEAAPHLGNEILLDSAANRYLIRRLKRISARSAWALVRHLQDGAFVPAGSEVGFGLHDALPPIVIELADGGSLILSGKIDRVDLLDAAGTRYVKIIDYKSGSKTFSFQEIYYGLQLQLLIYLDAYLKYFEKTGEGPLKPGGVFYFRISDRLLTLDSELSAEEIEQKLYEEMKMSGLLLADDALIRGLDSNLENSRKSHIVPMGYTKTGISAASNVATEEQYAALLTFVSERARALGESMKNGTISPMPTRSQGRTPCQYCQFRPVCRYDYEERPRWRDMKNIGKQEFWERIQSGDWE